MWRTTRVIWWGYLLMIAALVVTVTRHDTPRAYTSAERLRQQIGLADYSAGQIREVLTAEQLHERELEAKDKEAALHRKLAALDLLTQEADAQLAQIKLREGDHPLVVLTYVVYALTGLACIAVLWLGPISRWLLARRGRGRVASFLQRRVLLRAGFKLNREFRAEDRHELLELAGVVRAHLAAAANLLTELYNRVPTREQSDVPTMRRLLVDLDNVFAELGIRAVDPYGTKWSELTDAEQQFAREQAKAVRELQLRQSNFDGEVKRGVVAALEKLDLKSREAAVAATKAEQAASERRDEATRALAKLTDEQTKVNRVVTAAAESEAKAERDRAAAVREHQAAEQELRAAQQERLALLQLLVQLEGWAEFLAEKILAEVDTQPLLKARVAEWLQLAIPQTA